MYLEEVYEGIATKVVLVDYAQGYRTGEFDCGLSDYNDFLCNDAPYYIQQNIVQIKLLVNKRNADVIAYMALCSDSFLLDAKERESEGLDIPFNSVPALKIGQMSVSRKYRDKPYGSFMLFLALGYMERLNDMGVGCRFLVVDADVERDPGVSRFYERNGFVFNERVNKTRSKSKSMRYDLIQDKDI
ncbi:MAG TPA: N-acetyltransferase [Spirochaetia bacterium]|nr:N-acetyltransferase [Spirochaetia bacterium]